MQIIITQAGLQAAMDAVNDGVTIRLSHVALGDGQWEPDNTATGLQNELERYPVADGHVDGNVLHVFASLDSTEEYWVWEIGLYLDDGTLFGIYASNAPVRYKNAASGTDGVTLAIDLFLDVIPPGCLEVVPAANTSLNLDYAEEYARLATAMISAMRRDIAFQQARRGCSSGGGGLIISGGSETTVVSGQSWVWRMFDITAQTGGTIDLGFATDWIELVGIVGESAPYTKAVIPYSVENGIVTWQANPAFSGRIGVFTLELA